MFGRGVGGCFVKNVKEESIYEVCLSACLLVLVMELAVSSHGWAWPSRTPTPLMQGALLEDGGLPIE